MKDEEFDAIALIDAMAPLLGLDGAALSRPDVAAHLLIARELAAKLFAAPLDDHDEPAPVFTP
jgi:hypothetical protein